MIQEFEAAAFLRRLIAPGLDPAQEGVPLKLVERRLADDHDGPCPILTDCSVNNSTRDLSSSSEIRIISLSRKS